VPTSSILLSLGQEVRELRKQRNLSQEELAHRAGMHTHVVGRLERGNENITVHKLFAIAVNLGTTLSELFAGAEKRPHLAALSSSP
jgi:transcriptional regulator with XRE-family HTH domain